MSKHHSEEEGNQGDNDSDNFLEQVDEDVDNINPEEIHPDAPEFIPEEVVRDGEEWGANDEYNNPKPALIDHYSEFPNVFNSTSTRDKLLKMAAELENPDHEALVAVENDEGLLNLVAASFVGAADALREAAETMAMVEMPAEPFTARRLDEIAALAESFEASGDSLLMKQASMLDDLLITLASPVGREIMKKSEDDRIEQLKKKYKNVLEKQHEMNRIPDAVAAVEKSLVYQTYKPLERGLSQRNCPDHAGIPTYRVGENTVKCSLDGKVYNWNEGFETINGGKVPGVDIQNQHDADFNDPSFNTFDTRSERLDELSSRRK